MPAAGESAEPSHPVPIDAPFVEYDASLLVGADLGTVEALARLALAGRRLGFRVLLRGVPPDLRRLLELTGLADVFGFG